MSLSAPAFASQNTVDVDDNYILVVTKESQYGTVYYVDSQQEIQSRFAWDIPDVIMGGYSIARVINDPSLANLAWAVLDVAGMLPGLPSTAYFREGGKILLKMDEFAKFAKTTAGNKIVRAAIKQTVKFSDAISPKAIKEIKKTFKGTEAKRVLKIFEDAANKGFSTSKNAAGIKKITSTKKIGLQYTHEIKIKVNQYEDYRIFGYQAKDGRWVFDLFVRSKLHK
jgi:hypothetical protein